MVYLNCVVRMVLEMRWVRRRGLGISRGFGLVCYRSAEDVRSVTLDISTDGCEWSCEFLVFHVIDESCR